MTGIRFDHVHETVWRLKTRGLIHLEKSNGRLFLGINKDYSVWFKAQRPGIRPDGPREKDMAHTCGIPEPGNNNKKGRPIIKGALQERRRTSSLNGRGYLAQGSLNGSRKRQGFFSQR